MGSNDRAEVRAGRRRAPRRVSARLPLKDAGALALLLGIVLGVYAWSAAPPPAARDGTHGPFFLSDSQRSAFETFVDCENVSVEWWVATGSLANFSIVYSGVPAGAAEVRCAGPPPSNGTCPVDGCPAGLGRGLLACIETGTGGTCSFNTVEAPVTFEVFL